MTGRGDTLGDHVWRCPTRLQMEAVECGAAALAMVLASYGCEVPLSELRRELGIGRDGSSAAAIARGARRYGLDARGVSVDADGLAGLRGPVIAFWEGNHFVVVEGRRRGAWLVNDPARGSRRVSDEDFRASFSRVALTFEPTDALDPRRPPRWDHLRRLLRPLAGSRGGVAFAIGAGLVRVVPTIVAALLAGALVSQVLAARDTSLLAGIVILLVAVAAVDTVLAYLQRAVFLRLETKLTIKLELDYLRHLLHLPVAYFAERSPGQLTTRIGVNRSIAALLAGDAGSTLLDLMTALVYGIVLFLLQPVLATVVVALALVEVALVRVTGPAREARADQVMRYQVGLGGIALHGLRSIESLKASGADDELFDRWSAAQAGLVTSRQRFGVLAAYMDGSRTLLHMAGNLAVLVVGGLFVLDGHLTVAALVTFMTLSPRFLGPVLGLSRVAGTVQSTRAALDQLGDVLDTPTDVAATDQPLRQLQASGVPARQLSGRLELRDVTFGYDPNRPPLIEGLSLTVPAGGRVALVGRSGSGKSTVANLAAGLLSPQGGEVLLDGVPRASWPRAVVAASVAKVDPDVVLFEASVRDNVRLWDRARSAAAVSDAARDAAVYDEVVARPGGFDALVSEHGRNFSGGERQRLEIARALAGEPTLLILDEATSALDARTEQDIDLALRRRGVTCLVVAHRLSTIRDSDEIIVLRRGAVVQRGKHDDLMAVDGEYRDLVTAQ